MKKMMFAGAARGAFALALIGGLTANERRLGRLLRDPTGHPSGKSMAELAAETKAAFEKKHDEVKAIAEQALSEAKEGKTLSGTVKELADQAITGMNEAKTRMDDLEQKMARRTNEQGWRAFRQ